jgi:hypothetical protein
MHLGGWEVLCACGVNFALIEGDHDKEFVIEAWNKRTSPWVSLHDEPFPEAKAFLAGWFDEGDLEAIEWLSWTGDEGLFMNLNSNNTNDLSTGSMWPMFTHWMPIPE